MKNVLLLLCFMISLNFVIAQEISQEEKQEVIEKIALLVKENYVIEDVANKLSDFVKEGEYPEETARAFSKRLGKDLRRESEDKHFSIIYNAQNDFSKAITRTNKKINYGFTKVEILKGNIGYLRLSYFEDPKLAGKVAHSALSFLSNSNGIIIDLRDNYGGRKAMVQLILSYFFKEDSKHLYSIYGRKEEFHGYTEIELPGEKLADRPLYILINEGSFSAAEMFAFILQKQGRATLFGTTTAGGGHSIGNYPINNGFSINIPVGKIVDPKTKKGCEKIGVKPEIEVEGSWHIEKAHLTALEDKIRTDKNSSAFFEEKWQIDILKSALDPVELAPEKLQSYIGTYGRRILSYENKTLFYQGRAGIDKAKLIPIDKQTFRFDEVDFFRIQFDLDDKGKVVGLKGLYDDGYEDYSQKVD